MNKYLNERGFIFVGVIFLTLITSFAAAMLLNGISKLQNSSTVLQMTALHLMNEQFALIESGSTENIPAEDLTTYNMGENFPVTFNITKNIKTRSENILNATVKISWSVGGKNFEIEREKIILKSD